MTTFSFHPVKNITMGEGGAITTNDSKLYNKLILLRNNGLQRNPDLFQSKNYAYDSKKNLNPNYYEIQFIGLNFRSSDINCALGSNQLKKLDKLKKKRNKLVKKYDKLLKPLFPIINPVKKYSHSDTSYHLYVILIEFNDLKISRAELIKLLKDKNIGVQVHYPPLHLQKIYGSNLVLKGSEEYFSKCLSVPLFPQLSNDELNYIVDVFTVIIKEYKKK